MNWFQLNEMGALGLPRELPDPETGLTPSETEAMLQRIGGRTPQASSQYLDQRVGAMAPQQAPRPAEPPALSGPALTQPTGQPQIDHMGAVPQQRAPLQLPLRAPAQAQGPGALAAPSISHVAPPGSPGRAAAPRGASQYQGLIDEVSKEVGVDPEYMHRITGHESGGDPTATSDTGAKGFGQIMPATWKGLISKYGQQYGYGSDTPVTDPRANLRMTAHYTKESVDSFRSMHGRDPSKGELYTMHFLGPTGSMTTFNAAPHATMDQLYPWAFDKNDKRFSPTNKAAMSVDGRPMTVAEFRGRMDKIAGSGPTQGAAPPQGTTSAPGPALRAPEAAPSAPTNSLEKAKPWWVNPLDLDEEDRMMLMGMSAGVLSKAGGRDPFAALAQGGLTGMAMANAHRDRQSKQAAALNTAMLQRANIQIKAQKENREARKDEVERGKVSMGVLGSASTTTDAFNTIRNHWGKLNEGGDLLGGLRRVISGAANTDLMAAWNHLSGMNVLEHAAVLRPVSNDERKFLQSTAPSGIFSSKEVLSKWIAGRMAAAELSRLAASNQIDPAKLTEADYTNLKSRFIRELQGSGATSAPALATPTLPKPNF